jgi:hypothetical protein
MRCLKEKGRLRGAAQGLFRRICAPNRITVSVGARRRPLALNFSI